MTGALRRLLDHPLAAALAEPRVDGLVRQSVRERVTQHPAGHLLRHGVAHRREHGRRHVEHGGAGKPGARLDAVAPREEHAVLAVPHGARLGGEVRRHRHAHGAALEPVVRHDDHGRVVVAAVEELAEHGVVPDVVRLGDTAVAEVVVLGDVRHARRAVRHEVVRKRVHRVEVAGEEARPAGLEQLGAHPPERLGAGHDEPQRAELVRGLLEVGHVGRFPLLVGDVDERPHAVQGQVVDGDAAGVDPVEQLGRVRLAGVDRPVGSARAAGALERQLFDAIGHQEPAEGFGRPADHPADHADAVARLGHQLPQRVALTELGRHGHHALRRLGDEVEDAVLLGRHAGGDRRPHDGGEHGHQRLQVAGRALAAQAREVRELAGADHAVDEVGVARVEREHHHLALPRVRMGLAGEFDRLGDVRCGVAQVGRLERTRAVALRGAAGEQGDREDRAGEAAGRACRCVHGAVTPTRRGVRP